MNNWCVFVDNCKKGVKDLFCWAYIVTAGAPSQFLAERQLE